MIPDKRAPAQEEKSAAHEEGEDEVAPVVMLRGPQTQPVSSSARATASTEVESRRVDKEQDMKNRAAWKLVENSVESVGRDAEVLLQEWRPVRRAIEEVENRRAKGQIQNRPGQWERDLTGVGETLKKWKKN